jgi:hypothetical protein
VTGLLAGCRAAEDRVGCRRRTRSCGYRWRWFSRGMRSVRPRSRSCGLIWRCCSGCRSAGRRSSRARIRRPAMAVLVLVVVTADRTGDVGAAGTLSGARGRGRGGAAGLLAHRLPRRMRPQRRQAAHRAGAGTVPALERQPRRPPHLGTATARRINPTNNAATGMPPRTGTPAISMPSHRTSEYLRI